MKLDQLRKIIREEVRAAVKEELQEVMNEAVKIASTPTKQVSNTFTPVPKGQPKKWSKGTSATLDEMLNQTARSMSSDEARNFGSGQTPKPNFASSMGKQMGMTENTGPMPGLDITKLDFVKKAKDVLDLANKKSSGQLT